MAGYREFQTGEVLTAANVNDFLMQQSVMKFADASARDTALGTAVGGANALREGMVAYLDSTDEVLAYNGTAWATVGNAGIGSNVVQTLKTDTFTASVASGAVSGDAISVTITPTSATSRVLVQATLSIGSQTGASATHAELYRNGSVTAYRGDASGSRSRRSSGASVVVSTSSGQSTVLSYLDSPATTSAVTYSVRLGHGDNATQTVYLNRSALDTDVDDYARFASIITAIEVAA